jgi:CRP-like cAMP-binding protein
MLSPVERVIHLKAVPFFTDVPEEELADVAAVLEERVVEAGRIVVGGDEVDSSLYIIVAGQVRVVRGSQEPTILSEDDTFGELAILDPDPQPAEITAVEDTHLLQLDQESFRELVGEHRDVAWTIMQLLAQRLRRAQTAIRPGRPTGDILSEVQEQLADL